MVLPLHAKQPEQRSTVVATHNVEEPDMSPEEEMAMIDSTKVGIGGDESFLIPASELYEVWNNDVTNPYQVHIDSVISVNDTLSISLDSYTFPLISFLRVNSEFGKRGRRFHNGIDLKVNVGDTIVSTMPGMVRLAKYSGAFGNLVVVRHHNGLETYYGHLSKILVEPDQVVESGEIIGLGGNTGRSTGPHLHYEVRYLGKPINPRHVVDFDTTLAAKSDTLLLTAEMFKHIAKPTTASSATAATSTPVAKSGTGATWVVKSGDTLSRIAQRTGTSINYLCNVNGISRTSTLRLGQKIKY